GSQCIPLLLRCRLRLFRLFGAITEARLFLRLFGRLQRIRRLIRCRGFSRSRTGIFRLACRRTGPRLRWSLAEADLLFLAWLLQRCLIAFTRLLLLLLDRRLSRRLGLIVRRQCRGFGLLPETVRRLAEP